jgi:uncharacterized protein (DUF362 family)
MNRRYFFFGSLALLGMAGCNKRSRFARTRVSIVRAPNYSCDIQKIVRQLLIDHNVDVSGKRVLLKPNLVEFSSDAPINTHPIFVAGVAEAFRSLDAAEVRIAEGPGHRRMTMDLAADAGYFAAIPAFERRFTDLNLDDVAERTLRSAFSSLRSLYLPKTALDCDLLVSLPKMKTHHWTGATLSMKNLFGLVPGAIYGWPKNVLHWAGIDECIADLFYLFPEQFSIVDGIEGMQGNGPILGTSIWPGVIVAGKHPPSVDATCCRLMEINPKKIKYLGLVAQRSGWSERVVQQTGESINSCALRFALHRDLEHLRA